MGMEMSMSMVALRQNLMLVVVTHGSETDEYHAVLFQNGPRDENGPVDDPYRIRPTCVLPGDQRNGDTIDDLKRMLRSRFQWHGNGFDFRLISPPPGSQWEHEVFVVFIPRATIAQDFRIPKGCKLLFVTKQKHRTGIVRADGRRFDWSRNTAMSHDEHDVVAEILKHFANL